MAFLILDSHAGQISAFNTAVADVSSGTTWANLGAYALLLASPFAMLSYDRAYDVIAVCRGAFYPGYDITDKSKYYGPSKSLAYVSYDAGTLAPTGALAVKGASFKLGDGMPLNSASFSYAYGLCRDPNTGELRQCIVDFYKTIEASPKGYGANMSGESQIATDHTKQYFFNRVGTSTVHQLIEFYQGALMPALGSEITPNIMTFGDVVVFLYEDLAHHAWLSVIDRTTHAWRGTRRLHVGHVMQLCPMSVNRGMAICWQSADDSSPLMAITFQYDSGRQELVVEGVETLLTNHGYLPHPQTVLDPIEGNKGYATFDQMRQAVVLLSPDGETFTRYVTQNLCHPGRPASAFAAVPLSAVHAGGPTTFAVYTGLEINPAPAPTVFLSYGDASAGLFSAPAPLQTRTDDTGTGTFRLNWSSAASGVSVTPAIWFSSYSVLLSSTTAYGAAYGVDPMTILNASTTFTVSTGLSASFSATTITTAATILPGRPALQSDAVGAGTPQELSYPTSALASPLVFELNPQIWTNIQAELLTRPLYAAQRTLTKTANVQFVGDITDLECRLTWMGGGDRIAMTWTFFSQLWNYFTNVPDVASAGYITWQPRDLNAHGYQILFTNLEAGGQNIISLDSLAKAQDGFMHEAVTATFRIISKLF